MTTCATILGTLPLVLATGVGAPVRRKIGLGYLISPELLPPV